MRRYGKTGKMRYIFPALIFLAVGIRTWNASVQADRWAQAVRNVQADAGISVDINKDSDTAYDPLQAGIADKVLRFHILANSDSTQDQAVKKKVRDQIGQMMAPLLENSRDLAETKAIVEAHMDEIVDASQAVLKAEGYDYGAAARLTRVDFPVKTYGDYTFPAGEYEALEITLGEGNGHNWWCVLYPNMCFRGTVYEVVEDEADEALREVLTPEEYADVFDSGDYEIRIRFWEWLNSLNRRL